jgi:hypothetical protein
MAASTARPSSWLSQSTVTTGRARILALAVTHAPTRLPDDAVAFPAAEKQRLGLDASPSWIVTSPPEGNAFVCPGPDVRPVPEPPSGRLVDGRGSDQLLQQVGRSYLANRRKGIARVRGPDSLTPFAIRFARPAHADLGFRAAW